MNDQPFRPGPDNRPTKTHFRSATFWLAGVFIMLLLAACRPQGTFRTIPAHSTPGANFVGSPALISLPDLAESPTLYQDRLIRVSGAYMPAETFSACARNVRGPAGLWYLTADNWQLAVNGYAQVASRLEQGTTITMDGIFTYYEGPLGCGKDAAQGSLWYLRAIRIVEPNPLPLIAGGEGGEFAAIGSSLGMSTTVTAPVSEVPVESTPDTPPEADPATQMPSPTPTQPAGTPPGTEPVGTATATPPPATTPSPTPTVLSTPDLTPEPTAPPGGPPTQVPPSSTPTPEDGYPPPAPTLTPSPYPSP